jgi:hypothetical protein
LSHGALTQSPPPRTRRSSRSDVGLRERVGMTPDGGTRTTVLRPLSLEQRVWPVCGEGSPTRFELGGRFGTPSHAAHTGRP